MGTTKDRLMFHGKEVGPLTKWYNAFLINVFYFFRVTVLCYYDRDWYILVLFWRANFAFGPYHTA